MYDCDASIGNKSLVYNNMISIYGNATGMLPVDNAAWRPDDLHENAIQIVDGENRNR